MGVRFIARLLAVERTTSTLYSIRSVVLSIAVKESLCNIAHVMKISLLS
jgi:hypothetical protein